SLRVFVDSSLCICKSLRVFVDFETLQASRRTLIHKWMDSTHLLLKPIRYRPRGADQSLHVLAPTNHVLPYN
ncbi:hypothetical protein M9458_053682, partial [Cirrhinus mrigala]